MNVTRTGLASVLSTVDGVKGHAIRPKAFKRGDAWPLIGSVDRDRGLMFVTSWRIILCLGGDEAKADQFLEQVVLPIANALQEADALYVSSAIPFLMPTEAGDVLAAEITGTPLSVDNAAQGA